MSEQQHAPRQLIVLCDGTNNNITGRRNDTNVVKLAELLAADRRGPDERLVFYDPGVGNPGEMPGATGIDRLKRRLDRLYGLAFGRGVYENIADGYRFLMQHWRAGDELWIFGFSRGAFTARSIAGIVNRFGILEPQHENLVPTLLHVYFSDASDDNERPDRVSVASQWQSIIGQTQRLFASAPGRVVPIHFIGVWDTVAAVGLGPLGLRIKQLPKPEGKRFVHIRQALALDEHRLQFLPRLYAHPNGRFRPSPEIGGEGSIVQLWFPGAHCDAGGGYVLADSTASDHALAWIVSEAVAKGLRLAPAGRVLDSEAAVLATLEENDLRLRPAPPPAVHSQLRRDPWYALTGMAVRDTTQVRMDNGVTHDLVPEAHWTAPPRAARLPGAWAAAATPEETKGRRLQWGLLLVAAMLLLAMGQLQHGGPTTGTFGGDLLAALNRLPDYLSRNFEFQAWQLLGWLGGVGVERFDTLHRFAHPGWATAVDLLFIVCYALGLSGYVARAFGRLAGVRQAGDGADARLDRLGTGLMLLALFDLAENGATLLVLALLAADWRVLAVLAHLLLAYLSLRKLIALWNVLELLLRGLRLRR